MRRLTREALRLPWALPLAGLRRLAAPAGFGDRIDALAGWGDRIQDGLVDAAFDALDPRVVGGWGRDWTERFVEGWQLFFPGRNVGVATQELRNKLEVLALERETGRLLDGRSLARLPLGEVVAAIYELEPFPIPWVLEALGERYGHDLWGPADPPPRGLLREEVVGELPAASLLMLHSGLGRSLARRTLDRLGRGASTTAVEEAVEGFVYLGAESSRPGFEGPTLGALGAVARARRPGQVEAIGRALSRIAPEAIGYFWHGVGRALCLVPVNLLPCSDWPAFSAARREAPDEAARRAMVAGLVFAHVLVNQRQPEILLELVLVRHGEELARDEAFTSGVMGASILRRATTPDADLCEVFREGPASLRETAHEELWRRLVSRPVRRAVEVFHPILEMRDLLGETFQYHDFSILIQRDSEPVVPSVPPAPPTATEPDDDPKEDRSAHA